MTTDIAKLGLAVDSKEMVEANKVMDNMATAAENVEKKVERSRDSLGRFVTEAKSLTQETKKLTAEQKAAQTAVEQQARAIEKSIYNYQTLVTQLRLSGVELEKYNAVRRVGLSMDSELGAALREAAEGYHVASKAAKELSDIEAARAKHNATQSQDNWNIASGVNLDDMIGKARISAQVFEEMFRQQDQLEQKARTLRSAIDPVGSAFEKMNISVATASELLGAGKISAEEYAIAINHAKSAYLDYAQTIDGTKANMAAQASQRADTSQQNWDQVYGFSTAPKSARDSAGIFEEQIKNQERLATSARQLRAEIDPVGAAFEAMNNRISHIKELFQGGTISVEENRLAVQKARDTYLDFLRASNGVAESQQNLAAHLARTTQESIADAYGFNSKPKSAQDSASVFQAAMDRQDDMAKRAKALIDAINPLEAAAERLKAEMSALDELFDEGYLNSYQYGKGVDSARERFDELRRSIDGTADAERARAAQFQQTSQYSINSQLGVDPNSGAGTARQSASVFEEAARNQDRLTEAAGRLKNQLNPARGAALELERGMAELNEVMGAGLLTQDEYSQGVDRLTKNFLEYGDGLERITEIERARAAQNAQNSQNAINQLLGVDQTRTTPSGAPVDSASQSASVFMEEARAKKAAADATQDLIDREQRLLSSLNPVYSSEMKMNAAIKESTELLHANQISMEQHTLNVARATAMHDRFAKNLNSVGGGLQGYQLHNLSYQVNDIITSITSGISPMQTLAQQGPQIYQILSDAPGGVGAGFKSAGQAALRFLSPLNLVIGTLTALAAASSVAQNAFQRTQITALRSSEFGIGQRSGSNLGQINSIANDNYAESGLSRGQARGFISQLSATGKIDPSLYINALKQIKDYAATTGQDLDKAMDEYAKNLSGGVEGLRDFDEKLGNNSGALDENVERLTRAGDRTKAQKMTIDSLNVTVGKASELTSGWAQAWDKLSKPIATGFDVFGEFVNDYVSSGSKPSTDAMERAQLEKKIAGWREVITNNADALGGSFGIFDSAYTANIKTATEAVTPLLSRLDELEKKQKAVSEASKLRGESKEIDDIVNGVNPAIQQMKLLEDQIKKIQMRKSEIQAGTFKVGDTSEVLASLSTMEAALVRIKADAEAGGAALANMVRAAKFDQTTINYGDYAKKAAEANEAFARGKEDALRNYSNNAAGYANEIKSLEQIRDLSLQTLDTKTKLDSGSKGGGFNLVPQDLRGLFESASRRTGAPLDLISAIAKRESGFDVNADANKNFPESHAWGLMQIQPRTGKGLGIDRMNPEDNVYGGAKLIQQERDYFGSDELALWAFKRGRQYVLDHDKDIASADPKDRKYISDIMKDAGSSGSAAGVQLEGLNKDREAIEARSRALADSARWEGKSILEMDKATYVTEALNQRIAAGVPISQAMTEAIRANGSEFANLTQRLNAVKLAASIDFDRAQIGRDTQTANGFAQVRGAGVDPDSGAGQVLRDQIAINDNLKMIKSTGDEAFKGILSDIRASKSAVDVLYNALDRILTKLTDLASDQIWSAISGAMGKSGGAGGFFSSIFGGNGAGSGDGGWGNLDLASGSDANWLENGGVMTPRGLIPVNMYSKGGIGRAGEPQLAVFAEGSHNEAYVPLPDGRSIPVSMKDGAGAANSNQKSSIHVYPSPGDKAEIKETMTPQGPKTEIVMSKAVSDLVASGEMDSVMRKRYGLKATG